MIKTQAMRPRRIKRLTHDEAMHHLRRLVYTSEGAHQKMLALAEQAVRTAPDDQSRYQAERWAAPLRAGRRVKAQTYLVRPEGENPDEQAEA